MKIELDKEEIQWLRKTIDGNIRFCDSYHPRGGGVSIDVLIPDEDVIRSIYRKLNYETLDN